jgi:hypothetical protein
MTFYRYRDLDPDMMRIMIFCRDAGLYWRMDNSASRIEFYDYRDPFTALAEFTKEDDPDEVLESLKVLTVFG